MRCQYPVSISCGVLEVSASGYFNWLRRPQDIAGRPSGRHSDEALLAHIRAIHAQVKGEYGWPRMHKELLARGIRAGKDRVRKLMQQHGIRARTKRKFVVTTDSRHSLPVAPDLVQRRFNPEAPNQLWSGDITYIATDEGWLYRLAIGVTILPDHHITAAEVFEVVGEGAHGTDDRVRIPPGLVLDALALNRALAQQVIQVDRKFAHIYSSPARPAADQKWSKSSPTPQPTFCPNWRTRSSLARNAACCAAGKASTYFSACSNIRTSES